MRRTEQAQGLRLMKFDEVYGRSRHGVLSQAEAAEVLGIFSDYDLAPPYKEAHYLRVLSQTSRPPAMPHFQHNDLYP